jgi:hypothetical protein
MTGRDARREIFHLEALLRLYSHETGDGLLPALAAVKKLEDAVGAVSVPQNALKVAQKRGAPAEVIARLEAWRDETLKTLEQVVAQEGRSTVALVRRALGQFDFGTASEDRKRVKETLAGHLEHLREKKYDMSDLDSMHSLRRGLRWTVLYCEALDGLVQLSAVKHTESSYAQILGNADLEKQYKFEPFGAPKPGEKIIELPAELYAGLQKTIWEFGEIKDDAEVRHSLERAYREAGLPKHRLDDLLDDRGGAEKMTERATAVREEMKAEHLLKRLHHVFD